MLPPFKDWSQEVIYEGASFHEKKQSDKTWSTTWPCSYQDYQNLAPPPKKQTKKQWGKGFEHFRSANELLTRAFDAG